MSFDILIKKIDDSLTQLLPKPDCNIVAEAMHYSVSAGGKRLRALLNICACESFGGSYLDCYKFACAIEMIHTYSLIHDDLPDMDNDDYRRGKLTNHKVYGNAMAILAGDGLLNLAYETMLDASETKAHTKAARCIAKSAGVFGMVGGQALDVSLEGKQVDEATLLKIHAGKTGALLSASAVSGAIIGGASDGDIQKLESAMQKIGLAFQIQDDCLDITSNAEFMGKQVNKDEQKGKNTFVSFYGLKPSQDKANSLMQEAIDILETFNFENTSLLSIARQMMNRTN